ncbi:MAG: 3-deoxy-8-phosphooctulonate synthase [Bacteroidales bacterium]|nr:3-deoxy-8-phosphooctulonate synthase [Bacteroidales bacterium]
MAKLKYSDKNNFFLIAGPCVIENTENPFEIAERINNICDKLAIPFIFKASYRKANRTKVDSFRGIGDIKALKTIKKVGKKFNIPTITDVHTESEAITAAEYVDIIQIPAFLCRQTNLLIAAAKTKKWINIKKGQFVSAESMKFAIEKVKYSNNEKIMLTERGNMFGYNDLIVDFCNITEMKKFDIPVILDITHSLQQPNQPDGVTGGNPEMIETLAKAGIATGVDGIFLETHPNPAEAKSDGANMLQLDLLEDLLEKLVKVRNSIL